MSYALSKSTYRRRRRVASELRVLLRRLRGLKLADSLGVPPGLSVAYVVDALYREPSRRSAQVHAVSAVAGVAQCIASYDDSVLALEEVRAAALHVSAAEAYARVVSACDAEVS